MAWPVPGGPGECGHLLLKIMERKRRTEDRERQKKRTGMNWAKVSRLKTGSNVRHGTAIAGRIQGGDRNWNAWSGRPCAESELQRACASKGGHAAVHREGRKVVGRGSPGNGLRAPQWVITTISAPAAAVLELHDRLDRDILSTEQRPIRPITRRLHRCLQPQIVAGGGWMAEIDQTAAPPTASRSKRSSPSPTATQLLDAGGCLKEHVATHVCGGPWGQRRRVVDTVTRPIGSPYPTRNRVIRPQMSPPATGWSLGSRWGWTRTSSCSLASGSCRGFRPPASSFNTVAELGGVSVSIAEFFQAADPVAGIGGAYLTAPP